MPARLVTIHVRRKHLPSPDLEGGRLCLRDERNSVTVQIRTAQICCVSTFLNNTRNNLNPNLTVVVVFLGR